MTRRIPEQLDDGVVRIRRPNLGDAPAIFRAVENSRPELERWMNWCTPEYSLGDAEAWIMRSAIGWPRGHECPFVVESMADRTVVGCTGVHAVGDFDANYELGCWIRSDARGNGMARRAAALAARFAFEQLDAGRIGMLVAEENTPSLRVAEAIGAVREGVQRERILVRGERVDAVMLGLLPGELA